jgi:hypothetical protein
MLRFQIEQAKGFKRGSFATGVVFGRGGRDLEFLRSRLVAYGGPASRHPETESKMIFTEDEADPPPLK